MTVLVFTTRRRSFYAWLIRWFTWSPYSHVGILDEKRNNVVEARFHGGVQENGLHYIQKISSKVEYRVVNVPCETILENARSQLGKPYDVGAIFNFFFRRKWDKEEKWFCSELVAWAFEKAGVPLINEAPKRVTPRDLMVSALVKPR